LLSPLLDLKKHFGICWKVKESKKKFLFGNKSDLFTNFTTPIKKPFQFGRLTAFFSHNFYGIFFFDLHKTYFLIGVIIKRGA